jgi:hypothetical protein
MQNLVPVVRRQAYNAYYKHPELLEPIFNLFRNEPDHHDLMRNISAETHVPITTLYSWRERFRTTPSWRPSRQHFAENRRVFSDDVEEIIANFIRSNFVEPGRSLTRTTLHPLILALVHDLIPEHVLDDSFLNFKSFGHFLSRFMPRAGLSFRKARAARRPAIDHEECMRFLGKLAAAYHRYPPHLILNFDECNWYLVMAGEQTVAERGAECVHQDVNGDPKANFTFFATITAEGQKLPLIFIAKGKTIRCHKQFGSQDHHQFDV